MATKSKLITEIAAFQTNWTAKVVVAEKTIPKSSQRSPVKYQNLTLIDPQGNKVQATIYGHDISAFQDRLHLSKTYLISNASIKQPKPEYKELFGDVQWTINGRTKVEELQENNSSVLFSTYKFVPFDKLQEHMDLNTEISILAIAIDLRPKRQIQTRFGFESTIQEVVLIDQEFKTTMLTMCS